MLTLLNIPTPPKNRLFDECLTKTSGDARRAFEEYQRLMDMRATLRGQDNLIKHEQDRHKKAMEAIAAKVEEIRSKCGHYITKRHGDPSGGNDSWTQCLVCGKAVERPPMGLPRP